MPCFNAEKFIGEAIESILNQTFSDFELLIINDGSVDNSVKIIQSYSDKRIRLIDNKNNLGLITTLNLGIDESRGRFIACMHADDISIPDRLQIQLEFLTTHTEIGLVGGHIIHFGEEITSSIHKVPSEPDVIKSYLLFACVIMHPTVMFRKSLLLIHNLKYDLNFNKVEDFAFWQKCILHFPVANIDRVLLKYRVHPSSISGTLAVAEGNEKMKTYSRVYQQGLSFLGINATDAELVLHGDIVHKENNNEFKFLVQGEKWLLKILEANKTAKVFPELALENTIGHYWYRICTRSSSIGHNSFNFFHQSELSKYSDLSVLDNMKFFIKTLIKKNKI
jgi:glycosyltransferase involved in cell wall biosynthesis